jgi:hypothetical protein
MKPVKRLVIDTANILFRVASAHGKYNSGADTKDQAGLAMHMALQTIRSYYNKLKPDQVALSFEGANNWRKAHTRGERPEEAVSKRLYKGNRIKDDSMIPFFELIAAFEDLARNHTSLVCLGSPILEGDDNVAAYTKKFSALGDFVTILSDDKDFTSLLQFPNVRLVRPDAKNTDRAFDPKTKEKIDPFYFMYEKAFRGDGGDNVLPAYPKVRATRLKKSFDAMQKGDMYEHTNLMNETWEFTEPSTGESRIFKVGDLYKENQILMNLVDGQPADIQLLMAETVDHAVLHHGKFSMFKFQAFCGKYGLKRISEEITQFIPLLSSTGINSPLKAETKAIDVEKKRVSSLVF